MNLFFQVKKIIKEFCTSQEPVLLALSGGSDSLCLFYCLLEYRKKQNLLLHVVHVDHGWRSESRQEALILQKLASDYEIPFHLKVLNPSEIKGNLEAECRKQRYEYFDELHQQIGFQALLTGHHQDDQAETVLKRIMEGSHWSRWKGLTIESYRKGMRILRPLLTVNKKEIQQYLNSAQIPFFEDPSNKQLNFLRSRCRETIFPFLNREFGKEVQKNFVEVGKEASEVTFYFFNKLSPLLDELVEEGWGAYLNLQGKVPSSFIEIKYLVRLLCEKKGFFLSRELIVEAAKALEKRLKCKTIVMGQWQLEIKREELFFTKRS